MATSSVQLWERIHAAGLASPEDCRLWAIEIAKSSAADVLHEPSRLAAELIRLGKISPFQANVLYGNLPIPLVLGPYQITGSLESKFGPNWFQAIESAQKADSSRKNVSAPKNTSPLLCYLLNQQDIGQASQRAWPPSLRLAVKHVAVSHPSLDHWHFAGVDSDCVIGICERTEAPSLTEVVQTRAMSWRASVAMVEQIASGLQKLHEAGLVHGSVCTDSIWCIDENEFVLRRDPFFPPTTPYSSCGNSILVPSKEALIEVAAPELTLPNAVPTIQTDLYALGCIWYQSIARSFPLELTSTGTSKSWATAHLSGAINPLSEQQLPAPLQRCLIHLLAKNPSSRFSTATALIKAIEFAAIEAESAPKPVAIPATPQIATIARTTSKLIATTDETKLAKPTFPSHTVPAPSPAKRLQAQGQLTQAVPDSVIPKANSIPPIADTASSIANTVSLREDAVSPKANSVLPKGDIASAEKPRVEQPPKKSDGESVKPTGVKNKKKSKKRKKPAWVLPAMIGGACLLFGVLISVLVRNGSTNVPTAPNSNVTSLDPARVSPVIQTPDKAPQTPDATRANTPTNQPTESVSESYAVDSDDGKMLWAPPFSGSAYSLEWFPAGVETVVFLSGDIWHGRGAGGAIGKWWKETQPEMVKQFASRPLLDDRRIQAVAIALYPSKNPGLPQAVFRITFAQPVSIESIVQGDSSFKLQLLDPKMSNKKGFWSNGAKYNATTIAMDGLQTDSTAMIKRVVIGPTELLGSLPELNGGPAPLRRQLETLLKTTDSRSDLTILAAPSFLFGDGRELFSMRPKLQETLRASIDESVQAVMFATSLKPLWYNELRMLSSEPRDVGKFAAALKVSLLALPDEFEKSLSSGAVLHPYWRALGLRYPQMMRAMNRFLRVGLEDGQVVANVYLPADAMNNIAIASWMALDHTASGLGSSVPGSQAPTTKPITKSIEEILDLPVTVKFEQESLEAALQLIANEVATSLAGSEITMNIDGNSFQKEGITRNQSIQNFTQDSTPLRVVLTDLVRRANPVTTVKSAAERNQKVIWVVLDDPDRTGVKMIELTTRANAETKKFVLPKEFIVQ